MRLLPVCALICVVAGCSTPSIGPGYTDETIVMDDAYVGTWVDQDRTGRYRVTKASERRYAVSYERQDIGAEPFTPVEVDVVVFEVGGTRFIDAFPGEAEIERVAERAGFLFLPVHNFARVSMEEDVIRIDALDMGWVNAQRETLEAPHTTQEDNVILTAGPEAIQELLRRAMETPEAFSDDALILERAAGGG